MENLQLSTSEMEIFFSKTLRDISKRPKRISRKQTRNQQREMIGKMCSENISVLSNFFKIIQFRGCSDEGTPV